MSFLRLRQGKRDGDSGVGADVELECDDGSAGEGGDCGDGDVEGSGSKGRSTAIG